MGAAMPESWLEKLMMPPTLPTLLRGTLRSLREAIASGDAKTLGAAYSSAVSVLDKSVQKGVLHKNTASRYKSRLNARVKAVVTKKAA